MYKAIVKQTFKIYKIIFFFTLKQLTLYTTLLWFIVKQLLYMFIIFIRHYEIKKVIFTA